MCSFIVPNVITDVYRTVRILKLTYKDKSKYIQISLFILFIEENKEGCVLELQAYFEYIYSLRQCSAPVGNIWF